MGAAAAQQAGVRGAQGAATVKVPARAAMLELPASRRGAGIHISIVGHLWSFLGFKWLFEKVMNFAFKRQQYRWVKRMRMLEQIKGAGKERVPAQGREMTAQDMIDQTRGTGRFAQARQKAEGQKAARQRPPAKRQMAA